MELAAALRAEALDCNERRVLVLAGEPETTRERARKMLTATDIPLASTTLVGPEPFLNCERLDSVHASELLGQTRTAVVYDTHESLRPNVLGQLVGAVDGGGLVVLLAPPLSAWPTRRDDFDEALAVPPFETEDVTGHFRARLVETLSAHRGVAVIDVESDTVTSTGLTDPAPRRPTPGPTVPDRQGRTFPVEAYEACLTRDQAETLGELERLADPGGTVVVEADRGRGKSSAVGLAAGSLAASGRDVLVTAPQYGRAGEVFSRAREVLGALDEPTEVDDETAQFRDNQSRHSDAAGVRRKFGFPRFDVERVEQYKRHVYPNMLTHVWDGSPEAETRDKGGTDLLATGKPGSGKSTWLLYLAARLMEINDESVVWRASSSRSEWLPFAPWAKVCLPSSASVDARLVPKVPTRDTIDDVDVEDVVREVVYYDTVRELNREHLDPGMFHVVYPDPTMSGAQDVYESAPEKTYDDLEFSPENPSKHWWFAWVLDRIENGPYQWTSLMFDEIGDVAPQSAQKDAHATYQKVEMLKDCYVDARKTGLSIFAAGHSEVDIHDMVRRKIRWRCQMPGSANPTRPTDVVGFDSVPMDTDMTSNMKPGEILVFNERNFDDLAYAHLPAPIDHKLKITLRNGGTTA